MPARERETVPSCCPCRMLKCVAWLCVCVALCWVHQELTMPFRSFAMPTVSLPCSEHFKRSGNWRKEHTHTPTQKSSEGFCRQAHQPDRVGVRKWPHNFSSSFFSARANSHLLPSLVLVRQSGIEKSRAQHLEDKKY